MITFSREKAIGDLFEMTEIANRDLWLNLPNRRGLLCSKDIQNPPDYNDIKKIDKKGLKKALREYKLKKLGWVK